MSGGHQPYQGFSQQPSQRGQPGLVGPPHPSQGTPSPMAQQQIQQGNQPYGFMLQGPANYGHGPFPPYAPLPLPVNILAPIPPGQFVHGQQVPPLAQNHPFTPQNVQQHSFQQRSLDESIHMPMNSTFGGFAGHTTGSGSSGFNSRRQQQEPPRIQQRRSTSQHGTSQSGSRGPGGNNRFSENIYRQIVNQFPLPTNILNQNNVLHNLLSGMSRDMLLMQKQLRTLEEHVNTMSRPKTDQTTQTNNIEDHDEGSSNEQVPSSVSAHAATNEKVKEARVYEESETNECDDVEVHETENVQNESPLISEDLPERMTGEDFEHDSVNNASGHGVKVNIEGTVRFDTRTTTKSSTEDTRLKDSSAILSEKYSDVTTMATASSPIDRPATMPHASEAVTVGRPISRNPTASEHLTQVNSNETSSDGFQVPRARNVARSSPISFEAFKTSFAPGRALASPKLQLLKKEVAPSVTPTKEHDVVLKSASTKKRTPKSSKKPTEGKVGEKDAYDFMDFQNKLNEFETEMTINLEQYSTTMAPTRELGKPSTQESFHPLFDQISKFLRQPIIFGDAEWERVSRCLASRSSSYSSKDDLESQKMQIFLTLLKRNRSEVVLYDTMFLFGRETTKLEQESLELQYKKMVMGFNTWWSARITAKRPTDNAASQKYLLDWTACIDVAIKDYGLIMDKYRIWKGAFVKVQESLHPLHDQIFHFFNECGPIDPARRASAFERLNNQLAFYTKYDGMSSRKMLRFLTLLSDTKNDSILDDIVFLFHRDREVRSQLTIEASYALMILDYKNWSSQIDMSVVLKPDDVAIIPVKISNKEWEGFLKHINGQYAIRNKLENSETEFDEMLPFERYVYNGYKSMSTEFKFSNQQATEFLTTRKDLLERFAPQTKESKVFIKLYQFLENVTSSIVTFDCYYFKRCLETPETVNKTHAITDDEMFLTQVFRLSY